jgi:hypothetical protein
MHRDGTERELLDFCPLLLPLLVDVSIHDLEGEGKAYDDSYHTCEDVYSESLGVNDESNHRGYYD